jgi:oligoribonuclease NrnB/cAMP/cGMP phosphodiesterase (DHH superfamily)
MNFDLIALEQHETPSESTTPDVGLASVLDESIPLHVDSKVICYHHTDADGIGSAAIVKQYFKRLPEPLEVECIPLDYSVKIYPKSSHIDEAIVVVVDLSRDDLLPELATKAAHLIWIDHHFDPYTKLESTGITPAGIRNKDHSAIFLTWQYFFPDRKVPKLIQAINEFDTGVWTSDDPQQPRETTKAYYGFVACKGLNVVSPIWDSLFDSVNDVELDWYDRFVTLGTPVIDFELQMFKDVAEVACWEGKVAGRSALLGNFNPCRRQSVWSKFDPEKHEIVLLFNITKSMDMSFSIYVSPTVTDFNADQYAAKFEGGGHPQAAGFKMPIEKAWGYIKNCQIQ